jgi:ankyrin repeat protein
MKWIKGYIEHLRESQEGTPEELGQRLIGILSSEKAPDIEEVKRLIGAGADLEARDKYDETPLHCAATWGHTEAAKALIEAGADLEAMNKYDKTPLQVAAQWDHREAVRLLISAGADLEANRDGWTPLHWAAARGSTEAAKALIEAGADLEVRTSDGLTSLHLAADRGYPEVARILIKAGADISAGFGSLDELEGFFEGDIGWIPQERLPPEWRKRNRARGAFGRF